MLRKGNLALKLCLVLWVHIKLRNIIVKLDCLYVIEWQFTFEQLQDIDVSRYPLCHKPKSFTFANW